MFEVGQKHFFKTFKGRGRPYVGEVVKNAGIFTMMKDRNGDIVRVASKFVGRPYEFKPYNTKAKNVA